MTKLTSDTEYHVCAKGLKKSYGHIDALAGIDLDVRSGEFFTLFGPNGAGKTTLIKLLATLTSPTSGDLQVLGFEVRKEVKSIRSEIGVISHDTYLYENLSAFENITYIAEMYGLKDKDNKAHEVINKVGLESRMHDLVRTFSRGMKQRLTVARAVVHDPVLLLLDEPYTGLDLAGAKMFGEMLAGLKSQGRTILMTTHNIDEGLDLSDRVGILAKGALVYEGSAADLDPSDFKKLYISKVDSS